MNSVTAKRGAAFLDERLPGWADMVDTNSLDLSSSCCCVIAQVERGLHPRARFPDYERYERGLKELGITWDDARSLGFLGRAGGTVERTWKRLICARQTVEPEA